jgi:hypothetical protein
MATPAASAALKKLYALTIYVPVTHASQIRAALAVSGAGAIGAYDSCSFSSRGIGRFRPLAGANPFIGSVGAIEEVEEEKVETEVTADRIGAVLEAVRAAHPYETPAIHVYELIDWESFVGPKLPTMEHPSDAGDATSAAASAK